VTAATWATLVAVCSFVWGGFLLLLLIALRKERGKRAPERGLWVP
jgi:hypothetical protein